MSERFDHMAFVAVLVTAIILIFVAKANPLAVKVVADLAAAYWAVWAARNRPHVTDPSER